jgi:hypothetical protein
MSRPFFCAGGVKSREQVSQGLPELPCLLPLLALVLFASAAHPDDGRLALTNDSSPWLRAVGRLKVPGQRLQNGRTAHFLEDCSATLLTPPGRAEADTIVTAWHCLELYGDLSRAITFTARTASGELLEREAYQLADGGGMYADWAILRLRPAVSSRQLAAMQPHPAPADPGRPITMAGYSRDAGVGEGGRVLTFDPDCAITAQRPDLGETDCTAFKGASGGAVIQFASGGQPRFCGVISQGNGTGKSTYVPLDAFRKTLNHYLQ